MNLTDLLRPLDLLFRRYNIRYVVIGGYAVAAWGEERATRDIDVLCSANDSKNIIDALHEQRLDFEHRIGDYDDPIMEVIRIKQGLAAEFYEIDILIGIRNAPLGVIDRARIVDLGDLEIPVASPEDLVVLKLLGGSARDLEDAVSIIQIQRDRLDLDLIRELCPGPLREILKKLIDS